MRHLGTVKRWNGDRDFGFANSIVDGNDYYVNRAAVGQDLCWGAIIEFDAAVSKDDPSKTFARDVLVVEIPD